MVQASQDVARDGDPPLLTQRKAVSLGLDGLSLKAAACGRTGHRLRPDCH